MTRQDDEQRRALLAERLRDVRGMRAALKEAASQAVREHAGRPRDRHLAGQAGGVGSAEVDGRGTAIGSP